MNNILGIGVDIESIDRFRKYPLDRKEKFFRKIFTSIELDYCFKKKDPYPHLTARFVAKEAAIKAFSGYQKLKFSQIEVVSDETGKPILRIISDENKDKSEDIFVSLSHCDKYATAFVIICKRK
ncbi:holo-ACP synthase [candidate division KSB1 bacterium]